MNIDEIIRTRYTTKAYDEHRQITPQQQQQLLDLLRFSPSSVNSQPWHFFIAATPQAKAKIAPAFGEANAGKVLKSSMAVVFTTRTAITEAHLSHLLEKEQQDGRFNSDEAKAAQDKGRRYFVNLNSSSPEKQQDWMARQAYIALGFLLLGAASMGLNATPIEGFDAAKMNAILGLADQGLTSVVVATVGYSGEGDFNAALPKSRLGADEIITLL
ncbi:oxygen-insensitive NAD(P)H nitroreductase [Shimwellia pseudoproteus]|uniref:oxygen-insensitive NAD(P)H nitroreductase n=1 Tax=Shimwellia pseudoproteus TaxID=570012 RepID=UPI0018EDA22D|nr:oxygen-insensitive NAD(P)H nitroreductase [Shimwellia pseudoproteus]MBJ3816540.1 oxygen-insensitive NAD(P)H nitroreductase [Shimwellia pseudoproteus]